MAAEMHVVVRAAGERTEDHVHLHAQQCVGTSNVDLVRERPFADAHLKSVKLAADADARWSVLLDADVLLRSDAFDIMNAAATRQSEIEDFYMLNFSVLDLGWGGPSFGVHLYNTQHLRRSLAFGGQARRDQKPETRVCKEMAAQGIPTRHHPEVVGLHGYEQWHYDLYRTAYVRSVKYSTHRDFMLQRYLLRYDDLEDARSMLWGALDGWRHAPGILASLDVEDYRPGFRTALSRGAISEKAALAPYEVDNNWVISQIDAHEPDALYIANKSWVCPIKVGYSEPSPSKWQRARRRLRKTASVLLHGTA